MSRVLCVWELGQGADHVAAFLPLALALRERGHDVVFALRDLSEADRFLGRRGFALLPAPLWPGDSTPRPPAVSYAEVLFRFGFVDPSGLGAMVRAWRHLFDLVRPDLLVVDHGPTALLASRDSGIPRVRFGTGFGTPPRTHPMPSVAAAAPRQRVLDAERRVLDTVNAVRGTLGVAPLDRLAEILDADAEFLATFPELDPYRERDRGEYCGPLLADEGVRAPWPGEAGERIVGWLDASARDFDAVLEALRDTGRPTVVHASGIAQSALARDASSRLVCTAEPIRVAEAVREAHLVVGHGDHGVVAAALLAGRPLLLLPIWLEQILLAQNVLGLGAAKVVHPESKHPDYARLVEPLARDRVARDRAEAFAATHRDHRPDEAIARIVLRCEALLR
jgi:UDP:flavonoid glycosyltransferase YjiC (YdhE family)